MTPEYDVIVVGARCAGAPLAMLCARAGLRVLLCDRARIGSDTISTSYLQTPALLYLKRWGLLDPILATGVPPIRHFLFRDQNASTDTPVWPVGGIEANYAPRRSAMDPVLVAAAERAGADVRDRFAVRDLLRDSEDRVVGVRGEARGCEVTVRARVVVGADGRHSTVAKLVQAERYDTVPNRACSMYSFWTGIPTDAFEIHPRVMMNPTNGGETMLLLFGWNSPAAFTPVRADPDRFLFDHVAGIPWLRERVGSGKRASRWYFVQDVDNYRHRCWGPGWALVGDAGYHQQASGGVGISNAFRDATALSEALVRGLSGTSPVEEELTQYGEARDRKSEPIYRAVCDAVRSFTNPSIVPDWQTFGIAITRWAAEVAAENDARESP